MSLVIYYENMMSLIDDEETKDEYSYYLNQLRKTTLIISTHPNNELVKLDFFDARSNLEYLLYEYI